MLAVSTCSCSQMTTGLLLIGLRLVCTFQAGCQGVGYICSSLRPFHRICLDECQQLHEMLYSDLMGFLKYESLIAEFVIKSIYEQMIPMIMKILLTFVKPELSSPRAESARAVTGRRNSHSGREEDFLTGQPDFFTETAVTSERKVEKSFPRWEINRHVEG